MIVITVGINDNIIFYFIYLLNFFLSNTNIFSTCGVAHLVNAIGWDLPGISKIRFHFVFCQ